METAKSIYDFFSPGKKEENKGDGNEGDGNEGNNNKSNGKGNGKGDNGRGSNKKRKTYDTNVYHQPWNRKDNKDSYKMFV